MTKNKSQRPGRQRGQSTVEFVVLSLVMVPLLLIVPLLGKYMDIPSLIQHGWLEIR